jgi:hypothetical protein
VASSQIFEDANEDEGEMGLLVSYLSEGRIEADADALLDDFVEASGSARQAANFFLTNR